MTAKEMLEKHRLKYYMYYGGPPSPIIAIRLDLISIHARRARTAGPETLDHHLEIIQNQARALKNPAGQSPTGKA